MTQKIDETLKKIAAAMPNGTTPPKAGDAGDGQPARRAVDPADTPHPSSTLGKPDCPVCHGAGLVRYELPVGHPDFGKIQVCTCRQAETNQQTRDRLFALSNLQELAHLTFENFMPRGRVGLPPYQADSLERAFNQAQQYAQNLKGWLLFQGEYGCGKTHLAAAVANYAVTLGVPTLFLTVPDLLDSLRFSYQSTEDTFEQRFEQIRNARLLVLDDFGTQNATPWAQEKLFQIINYRYINHLPLVVTTNLALRDIEERISSRLQDPELVTRVPIQAPDFRNPAGDSGHPALSSLELHHNRTFATFDLRKGEPLEPKDLKSLENAFELARRFAERPQGWLVLTGPYGCGKTHLAAAIANYRHDLGNSPLFVVVPDLLDHLRATFSPSSAVTLDRRFEEVRKASLLVLDDLGTQSMTPWVREKLYQLFNYRYNAELPTVMTTADFRDEMDPRLLSRLQDTRLCTICPITAPAYRGRPRADADSGRPARRTRKS